MHMDSTELYCLGFLSGLSKTSDSEESTVRRSAYRNLSFIYEEMTKKEFGLHYCLVSSIGRSSNSCSISWVRSELELYLDSVELDRWNYRHFAMGCIDAGLVVSGLYNSERPHIEISTTPELLGTLSKFIEETVGAVSSNGEYFDVDALDIMGHVYCGECDHAYDKSTIAFHRWRTQIDGLTNSKSPKFFFSMTREDAEEPFKARISDSGFDLTLLDVKKSIGSIDLYSTGIKAYPAYGWYFMLVPRSSIIKSGYMLANNCGIIDRSYTGEILVPLVKVDEDAPDLELPCRLVQLIPQPIIDFDFQYTDDDLDSSRGEKGFGSSGR